MSNIKEKLERLLAYEAKTQNEISAELKDRVTAKRVANLKAANDEYDKATAKSGMAFGEPETDKALDKSYAAWKKLERNRLLNLKDWRQKLNGDEFVTLKDGREGTLGGLVYDKDNNFIGYEFSTNPYGGYEYEKIQPEDIASVNESAEDDFAKLDKKHRAEVGKLKASLLAKYPELAKGVNNVPKEELDAYLAKNKALMDKRNKAWTKINNAAYKAKYAKNEISDKLVGRAGRKIDQQYYQAKINEEELSYEEYEKIAKKFQCPKSPKAAAKKCVELIKYAQSKGLEDELLGSRVFDNFWENGETIANACSGAIIRESELDNNFKYFVTTVARRYMPVKTVLNKLEESKNEAKMNEGAGSAVFFEFEKADFDLAYIEDNQVTINVLDLSLTSAYDRQGASNGGFINFDLDKVKEAAVKTYNEYDRLIDEPELSVADVTVSDVSIETIPNLSYSWGWSRVELPKDTVLTWGKNQANHYQPELEVILKSTDGEEYRANTVNVDGEYHVSEEVVYAYQDLDNDEDEYEESLAEVSDKTAFLANKKRHQNWRDTGYARGSELDKMRKSDALMDKRTQRKGVSIEQGIDNLVGIGSDKLAAYKPAVAKAAKATMDRAVAKGLAEPFDFGRGKGKYRSDLSHDDIVKGLIDDEETRNIANRYLKKQRNESLKEASKRFNSTKVGNLIVELPKKMVKDLDLSVYSSDIVADNLTEWKQNPKIAKQIAKWSLEDVSQVKDYGFTIDGLEKDDIVDFVLIVAAENILKQDEEDFKESLKRTKKSVKEEYGEYQDDPNFEQIADQLEGGNVYGMCYGGAEWGEVEINGVPISDLLKTDEVLDWVLHELSYPVRDGHAYYNDLNLLFNNYSYEDQIDHTDEDVIADLVALGFDEDEIKEMPVIKDPEYRGDISDERFKEIQTWVDFDILYKPVEDDDDEEDDDYDENLNEVSSKTLKAELEEEIKKFFKYEPDALDWAFVEITKEEGRTRVEVRAELDYSGMWALSDVLDPVVKKYDKEAYFDQEQPGIMVAFIENKKGLGEKKTCVDRAKLETLRTKKKAELNEGDKYYHSGKDGELLTPEESDAKMCKDTIITKERTSKTGDKYFTAYYTCGDLKVSRNGKTEETARTALKKVLKTEHGIYLEGAKINETIQDKDKAEIEKQVRRTLGSEVRRVVFKPNTIEVCVRDSRGSKLADDDMWNDLYHKVKPLGVNDIEWFQESVQKNENKLTDSEKQLAKKLGIEVKKSLTYADVHSPDFKPRKGNFISLHKCNNGSFEITVSTDQGSWHLYGNKVYPDLKTASDVAKKAYKGYPQIVYESIQKNESKINEISDEIVRKVRDKRQAHLKGWKDDEVHYWKEYRKARDKFDTVDKNTSTYGQQNSKEYQQAKQDFDYADKQWDNVRTQLSKAADAFNKFNKLDINRSMRKFNKSEAKINESVSNWGQHDGGLVLADRYIRLVAPVDIEGADLDLVALIFQNKKGAEFKFGYELSVDSGADTTLLSEGSSDYLPEIIDLCLGAIKEFDEKNNTNIIYDVKPLEPSRDDIKFLTDDSNIDENKKWDSFAGHSLPKGDRDGEDDVSYEKETRAEKTRDEAGNKIVVIPFSIANPDQHSPADRIYHKLIITQESDGTYSYIETENLESGEGFASAKEAVEDAISGQNGLEDLDDFRLDAKVDIADITAYFDKDEEIAESDKELLYGYPEGSGKIEIGMTRDMVASICTSGSNAAAVEQVKQDPIIRKQLDEIPEENFDVLKRVLDMDQAEFDSLTINELEDYALWLAAWDIYEDEEYSSLFEVKNLQENEADFDELEKIAKGKTILYYKNARQKEDPEEITAGKFMSIVRNLIETDTPINVNNTIAPGKSLITWLNNGVMAGVILKGKEDKSEAKEVKKSKYTSSWQLDGEEAYAKIGALKDNGYQAKIWDKATAKAIATKTFASKEEAIKWAKGQLKSDLEETNLSDMGQPPLTVMGVNKIKKQDKTGKKEKVMEENKVNEISDKTKGRALSKRIAQARQANKKFMQKYPDAPVAISKDDPRAQDWLKDSEDSMNKTMKARKMYGKVVKEKNEQYVVRQMVGNHSTVAGTFDLFDEAQDFLMDEWTKYATENNISLDDEAEQQNFFSYYSIEDTKAQEALIKTDYSVAGLMEDYQGTIEVFEKDGKFYGKSSEGTLTEGYANAQAAFDSITDTLHEIHEGNIEWDADLNQARQSLNS